MKFIFTNDIHNTASKVTARNWQISQRQVRRIWNELCGETDCQFCNYGGLHGPNKYRLAKLGGAVSNDGAEIQIEHYYGE